MTVSQTAEPPVAHVRPSARLRGDLYLPGDKSVSHRALILAAAAEGESLIRGAGDGADVRSTAGIVAALGATVERLAEARAGRGATVDYRVTSPGAAGLHEPRAILDCGNSGTSLRLMTGFLAGLPMTCVLDGDASLRGRPVARIIEPLRSMGAVLHGRRNDSLPPLTVIGRTPLRAIDVATSVPSAQVKSALLLAGLFAEGTTAVIEPVRTRDHTELMLRTMGADITSDGERTEVRKATRLKPIDIEVPGDLSAASFWLVAGALVPGSTVHIPEVGFNPTRTAFVQLLRESGFSIHVSRERVSGGEPVADLTVHWSPEWHPMEVSGGAAAEMIDELPILAVAATQLPGVSRISGAAELRVKESDRIAAIAEGLTAMGANITANDDGWTIEGISPLHGARVHSHGDHRVAMALAVAGLMAEGETEIEDAECVEISYPEFFDQLESL